MKFNSAVKFSLFLISAIILNFSLAEIAKDPYKLLGVDRKASLQDIRRAYKQLAKEW